MARGPWHTRVEDLAGKPRGGALVYVYERLVSGAAGDLATLYKSETGFTTANPAKATKYGELTVWLDPGAYLWYTSYSGFTSAAVPFDIAVGSGDSHYLHEQDTPSAIWIVPHGLGKYPSVTCIDSAGTELTGRVEHIDINNLKYHHDAPTAGILSLN